MLELNPFNVAYLTEASYGPRDLLARYSFLPFRYVQNKLSSAANVFLVGRRGTGKTMLLKLFEPELMQLLFSSEDPEHIEVKRSLPAATIGIYVHLGSPEARLNQFQGRGRSAEWWRLAYADYLNCILLQKSFSALDTMTGVGEWREAAGLTQARFHHEAAFAANLKRSLAEESSVFESADDLEAIMKIVSDRIRHWRRFLNSDKSVSGPPETPLPLGVPLFGMVRAVREARVFQEPFRLFLLLDQYEYVYDMHPIIDHRPMFNQAMYFAARGGTGVEFKIGTRQYAVGSLTLLDGVGRLERREKTEVHLDELGRRYFRPFVLDVFQKRLESAGVIPPERHRGRLAYQRYAARLASQRLPILGPREEALQYMGEANGTQAKYLPRFVERWSELGLSKEQATAAIAGAEVGAAHPLTGMLACIALSRWLRDGCRDAPVGCTPWERRSNLAGMTEHYLRMLLERIERRYAGPRSGAGWLREVDNFVRDAEHAALFQLASAYKNQRKYFTGIDTIIRLSSNVAVVFLEIMKSCYEFVLLEGLNPRSDAIPYWIQSEAVYRVSDAWFNSIPLESGYGQTLQELIRGLGLNFRRVQLELTAPDPAPNGFSIVATERGEPETQEGDPRNEATRILFEAVSWGLLEEFWHQDKKRAQSKRAKYILNRIYCPYFGLAETTKKDPMYVKNLGLFIKALLEGEEPHEFERRLERGRGGGQADRAKQPELFER